MVQHDVSTRAGEHLDCGPVDALASTGKAPCLSGLVASPRRSAWIVCVATACSPPAARG